jgi:hypothetical protein
LYSGIARAVGTSKTLGKLYRAAVPLEPGDRVVLATDGLTDTVPSHELADIVRGATSPAAAAERVNTLMTTRYETGQLPAPLGGSCRRDDWTAIFRFFNPVGGAAQETKGGGSAA